MSCLAPLRAALIAVALSLAAPAAAPAAEIGADVARLARLLRITDTVAVMRQEGLRYGREIAREMLPDAEPESWDRVIGRIYDTDKMEALVVQGLAEGLAGTDPAPLLAYFGSEAGREVVRLELAARRAFLDPAAEAAARETYAAMRNAGAPLLGRIDALIDDSDLIELNVMGALNANLMFYRGLADGGASAMTEAEMIADVWTQEAEIRADTTDWLRAFLLMAYRPLPPERLADYAALFRSAEGRALNRAMFLAFDRMYDEISYLTGRAVARHLESEKL